MSPGLPFGKFTWSFANSQKGGHVGRWGTFWLKYKTRALQTNGETQSCHK